MLRSILVPLDGSAWSEQALPAAQMIAQNCSAQLYLALVHVPFVGATVEGLQFINPEVDQAARTNDALYLAAVQRQLEGDGCFTQVKVCDGAVAPALADFATEVHADLVVMTTHGRGGLARMWLGSVADELVRCISTPVLLIRPQPPVDDTMAVPTFRHILVPLDGSPAAERVLPSVLALSKLSHARLTLLHVVDALVPASAPFTSRPIQIEYDVIRQRQHIAEQYVHTVKDRLQEEGVEVHTCIVTNDQPASTILETAQVYHADLIAMTTHGFGGLQRLLLGSIADKVLRGTTLPVLMYRPSTDTDPAATDQTALHSANPASPTATALPVYDRMLVER